GRSLRHKGLQLDGDDVSRVRIVGYADAIRYRFHRLIHNRRHDGTDGRGARTRRSPARHLLCDCSFPLHHGGRNCNGISWRCALLVAEDKWETVSRGARATFCGDRIFRLQSYIFPPAYSWISWDAPALLCVSGGISDAARA